MKMPFPYGTLPWEEDHWPDRVSLCYSVGAPEACGNGGTVAVGRLWAKARDQDRQLQYCPSLLPIFYPTLALFLFTSKMLRHRRGWLLLSVGLNISLVTIFHGSEQARLFSAVSKSWHGHSNGGQETGAASMWYLVSVIFCNTYVLPVEMAEASVFVSHLIHLALPCCVCLSGSRWSFVFWDPLSPRPYLCLTGQGIYNLLPLLCKLHTLPGSQQVASASPIINQFLLLPRKYMQ